MLNQCSCRELKCTVRLGSKANSGYVGALKCYMVVTERNQAWDLSYFPWWCVFDVK